jgi:cyclopropane-fatty-acyl-phospholipid synthase
VAKGLPTKYWRLFGLARLLVSLRSDREDYRRTLAEWVARLKANRPAAVQLVGEEVVARYERFLGLFMIGFHLGTVNLVRLAMRRLDSPRP